MDTFKLKKRAKLSIVIPLRQDSPATPSPISPASTPTSTYALPDSPTSPSQFSLFLNRFRRSSFPSNHDSSNGSRLWMSLYNDHTYSIPVKKFVTSLCDSFGSNMNIDQYALAQYLNAKEITPTIINQTIFKSFIDKRSEKTKEDRLLFDSDYELSSSAICHLIDFMRPFDMYKSENKVTLGHMYYTGTAIPKDVNKAFKLFQEASRDTNNTKAITYLGVCHLHGIGTLINEKLAFQCFYSAAEKDYPLAQLYLARLYRYGIGTKIDFKLTVEWLMKAADSHSLAQVELADLYRTGQCNVPKDPELAFQLYSIAASDGVTIAQYNLGQYYFKGKIVKRNDTMAFLWFEKAANDHFAEAQAKLGYMYEYGLGCDVDLNAARFYYQSAANQGVASAQNNLGFLYRYGKGVDVDFPKSFQLFSQAAKKGDVLAQNHLGQCYENGVGCDVNLEIAVYWYHLASEKGLSAAQNNLALCNELGKGMVANELEAIRLYTLAANQGNVSAAFNLAEYFETKRKDLNLARVWYSRAAELGDLESKTKLDQM
ncbi:hypothetical protein HDV02_002129 [Globomyces sp. JEL0801]|nr:hypothetical protein HDV02_002129 [Globomyces sp. JEL0801]